MGFWDVRRSCHQLRKSATEHLLGAAGGSEEVFTILALRDQIVPAALNLENRRRVGSGIVRWLPAPSKVFCSSIVLAGVISSVLFRRASRTGLCDTESSISELAMLVLPTTSVVIFACTLFILSSFIGITTISYDTNARLYERIICLPSLNP